MISSRRNKLLLRRPPFSPKNGGGTFKIWLKSDTGVSFDGSSLVSVWADQSGNGNDVVQATGSKQPLLIATQLDGKPSIRFDGIDDLLKAIDFSWAQPITLYMVFRRIAFGNNDLLFFGKTSGSIQEYSPPSNSLRLSAGTSLNYDSVWVIGTAMIGTMIYNGVTSVFQKNDVAEFTGDVGAGDLDGASIGAHPGGSLWSNTEYFEIIGYGGAHTTDQRTRIKAYLATRYPSL